MELLDSIKHRLKTRNLTALAEASGIKVSTLYAIASGRVKNPGVLTLEAIKKALDEQQ
jgi:transcriptional regulator with XRE-family HTH domain